MTTAVLYDREKCRRRSVLAAARGIEATPVKFYGSAMPADVEGADLIRASGDLPRDQAAVDRINSILGLTNSPKRLTADKLHVRYMEAGNTNYIRSRLMFLAPSTLANIARAADQGFAFMNSHRTGGLSSDPEIPLGRTFAGRHETLAIRGGREFQRTLVGVYMVRGEHPNGKVGPSTDSIAAGIDAGTIFDVSLGLKGPARLVCDICDKELDARDSDGVRLCPHVPGTSRYIDDDQRESQRQRGVDDGVATYSIHDATAGEVSAVFDGAVPGAGFRLMLSAYSRGQLSGRDLAEARLSYGPLLAARFDERRSTGHRPHPKRSVFTMARRKHQGGGQITLPLLLDEIRDGNVDPNDITVDLSGGDGDDVGATPPAAPAAPALAADEVAKLREDLRIEREARQKAEADRQKAEAKRLADQRTAALDAVERDADAAVLAAKNDGKLTGETAKAFRAALADAGRDDLDHPLEGGRKRFDSVKSLMDGAARHGTEKERIATRDPRPVDNYGASGDPNSNLDDEVAKQNARHMPKRARRPQAAGA